MRLLPAFLAALIPVCAIAGLEDTKAEAALKKLTPQAKRQLVGLL